MERKEASINEIIDMLTGIKNDVNEVKMVLGGSPLGVKGMNERLNDVEQKVNSLKMSYWKAQGVLFFLVPLLFYVIQKYLV